MRVLLVEDDLFTANQIEAGNRAAGLYTETARCTLEAMDLLRHDTYEVAVVDHYLGGETTLFLVSHLRLRHPETRVITITGAALFARGYGLEKLGCDFLFRKPFAISDLVEVIRYLGEASKAQLTEHRRAGTDGG
ncbi:MAG: response regulator [Pseudomonadota bacterium]